MSDFSASGRWTKIPWEPWEGEGLCKWDAQFLFSNYRNCSREGEMPHMVPETSCQHLPPAFSLQLSFKWKKIVFCSQSLTAAFFFIFFSFLFPHKHHEIVTQKEEERERLIKQLVFQFEAFTDNQKLLELRFQGFVIWTESLDRETGCN